MGGLLPLMCVAWYSGRYYQGVQAECSVTLDKVMLTTRSGQPGIFRRALDFNLPRRQGYYEILNPSGGLVWSGTFYMQANMDWTNCFSYDFGCGLKYFISCGCVRHCKAGQGEDFAIFI